MVVVQGSYDLIGLWPVFYGENLSMITIKLWHRIVIPTEVPDHPLVSLWLRKQSLILHINLVQLLSCSCGNHFEFKYLLHFRKLMMRLGTELNQPRHMPDEISNLSQVSGRTDEPKISSGLSQPSHMGDELFEIVQYLLVVPLFPMCHRKKTKDSFLPCIATALSLQVLQDLC